MENGRDPWLIHYTELGPAGPDSQLKVEWAFYLREAGRLLAEGHEGKFVLIKGEEIIGLFDTGIAASTEGHRRYLRGPFLVHQIKEWERLVRIPQRYL